MAIWLFALHYHATPNALADARLVLASNAGDSVRRAKAIRTSAHPPIPSFLLLLRFIGLLKGENFGKQLVKLG